MAQGRASQPDPQSRLNQLLEDLGRRGRVAVRDLPEQLRTADLLALAWARRWIRLVVLADASIGFGDGSKIERFEWTDFRACGFGLTVSEALVEDDKRERSRGLHIALSRDGEREWAERLAESIPAERGRPKRPDGSERGRELRAFVDAACALWNSADDAVRTTGPRRDEGDVLNPSSAREHLVKEMTAFIREQLRPAQTRLLGATPENHYRHVRDRTDEVIRLAEVVVEKMSFTPKHGSHEWGELHGQLNDAILAVRALSPAWENPLTEVAGRSVTAASPKSPIRRTISVDVERKLVILDAVPYELESRASAELLRRIVEKQGDWVSASKWCPKGMSYKRIKDKWPGPVVACLDPKPGGGTRLRPGIDYACQSSDKAP